ncbi:MAG TPA: bifunctional phosphoribosylaminoimidazolecarboxamide formyltransferase/IMP cyclohydrolase [Candidatus Omnitrophota bacterium]|nr:bifunctional phosphoribosylaminoimidazolecarboxamide formyltransferase/IMP cyclohydrolase [Candidatus Omnitrophota bacterium]
MLKVKRAIISVSDKTGIIDFAKGLRELGVEILSTGGTLATFEKNGIKASSISSFTGFPEILDGRVKTLHPKIFGGLLFLREEERHVRQAEEHGIVPVDMVVVNLYPFEQTIRKEGVTFEEAIEQIDIGGPSLLRAASKNFHSVAVLCDPADYEWVLKGLKGEGLSEADLTRLATKVFQRTSAYDRAIAAYFEGPGKKELFPERLDFSFKKGASLRYGENPHQKAAVYGATGSKEALSIRALHGKELSYNNLIDLESAWDGAQEFEEPAACVIKHNTPCGMASAGSPEEAVSRAIDCDPDSAFGGIIGLNRPCGVKTAETILAKLGFLEVIICPSFEPEALEKLSTRKNLRLVEAVQTRESPLSYRYSKLGLLVQETDPSLRAGWNAFREQAKCVTQKKPLAEDLEELFFAWRCAKVVKSNAIVLSKGRKTVGIGGGQVSRIDAVKIACEKAGEKTRESYLASDAFFPMPDSIEKASQAGIRAIVQPGGSVRDAEVIQAADRLGLIMIFTGARHFRH